MFALNIVTDITFFIAGVVKVSSIAIGLLFDEEHKLFGFVKIDRDPWQSIAIELIWSRRNLRLKNYVTYLC